MRRLFGKQLEAYLALKIHGRKPPQLETKLQRNAKPNAKRPGPPRRTNALRDPEYLAWIRTLPSVISGRTPCDACHTGEDGGMATKASDASCVPMTRDEHQEYHRIGKRAFERLHGVRFAAIARALRRAWKARGRAA